MILCLYVDDIFIFGSNFGVINAKRLGFQKFWYERLKTLMLGIKLFITNDEIILNQTHAIEKNLKKFGFFNLKLV